MDVEGFPQYKNQATAGDYTFFKPGNLLPQWFKDKIISARAANIGVDNLIRNIVPGLPADPNYLREHGVMDTDMAIADGMNGMSYMDVGNFERNRPIIGNTGLISLEPPHEIDKNKMLERMMKGASVQKKAKNSMLSEEFKKTIVKNKNIKAAGIGGTLGRYIPGVLGDLGIGYDAKVNFDQMREGGVGNAVQGAGGVLTDLATMPSMHTLANKVLPAGVMPGLNVAALPFAASGAVNNLADMDQSSTLGGKAMNLGFAGLNGLQAGWSYNAARPVLQAGLSRVAPMLGELPALEGSALLARPLTGLAAGYGAHKLLSAIPEADESTVGGTALNSLRGTVHDMGTGAAAGFGSFGPAGAVPGAIAGGVYNIGKNTVNAANNGVFSPSEWSAAASSPSELDVNKAKNKLNIAQNTTLPSIFQQHGMRWMGPDQPAVPMNQPAPTSAGQPGAHIPSTPNDQKTTPSGLGIHGGSAQPIPAKLGEDSPESLEKPLAKNDASKPMEHIPRPPDSSELKQNPVFAGEGIKNENMLHNKDVLEGKLEDLKANNSYHGVNRSLSNPYNSRILGVETTDSRGNRVNYHPNKITADYGEVMDRVNSLVDVAKPQVETSNYHTVATPHGSQLLGPDGRVHGTIEINPPKQPTHPGETVQPVKQGMLRRRNTGLGDWVNPRDLECLSKSAQFNQLTPEEYIQLPLAERVETIGQFFFPAG